MWRRPQTRLPRLGTRLPRLGPRLGAEFSSANQGRRWTYPTNGDTDAAGAAAAAGAADASHCCPRKMVLVARTHASDLGVDTLHDVRITVVLFVHDVGPTAAAATTPGMQLLLLDGGTAVEPLDGPLPVQQQQQLATAVAKG